MNVRTKWHRVVELANAGELYFMAPRDGKATRIDELPNFEGILLKAQDLIRAFSDVPKIVIDPELFSVTDEKEYTQSLFDMKKANVCQLPYPAMIVEQPTDAANHSIGYILDKTVLNGYKDSRGDLVDFAGCAMAINRDRDGEYLCISPGMIYLTMGERDGEPWLHIETESGGIFPNTSELSKLVEATYMKSAGNVYNAVFCAMLLMSTAGVAKQVIDVERLNKKRALSNKPPIPRHTYIHIGRVYRSARGEAFEEYVPRKSPRPHWRRGHLRTVRYGVGYEKIKQVYIQARLVAFKRDTLEPEPKAPSYTVKV